MPNRGIFRPKASRPPDQQRAAELRARIEELTRANRGLADFAFIVAHELKEPLAGLRAYCELLWEEYESRLDSDGRRCLGTLLVMCDRLGVSIDGLLAYCRAGQSVPSKTAVDLNDVVERLRQTLRPSVGSAGPAVRVVDRLPVVRGDATLIGKVFRNLISNGLKFNRSRQPCVEIGCLAEDPPVIYVRDNGIGIAKAHHEEVFTIFRRLHSRSQYDGSGAGLTIAGKIVESHGGQIWLESEPGRGATFYFSLGPAIADAPTIRPATKPPHWIGRRTGRLRRRASDRGGTAKGGPVRPTRVPRTSPRRRFG